MWGAGRYDFNDIWQCSCPVHVRRPCYRGGSGLTGALGKLGAWASGGGGDKHPLADDSSQQYPFEDGILGEGLVGYGYSGGGGGGGEKHIT